MVGIEMLLIHQDVQVPILAHVAMANMIWINLAWGLINLLPVFPLDGGQICQAALSHWRRYDGFDISLKLSMVTAIGVALAAYRFDQIYLAVLFGFLAFQNLQALQGGRLR
jgi:membrane-associated protease RseP (regulator of RpoE activity)